MKKDTINIKGYKSVQLMLLLSVCIIFSTRLQLSAESNIRQQLLFEESPLILDSIMTQRSVSIGELILGQTANVKVISAYGAPGASADIQIRGGGSVRGDYQPLYILDGIMINPSQLDVANAWSTEDRTDYQTVQDMLWAINAEDIKSIQVLKDASATAIYGSKGANGVIIIDTKVGSRKEKEITWSSNVGISTLSHRQDLLTGSLYRQYFKELTGKDFGIAGTEIDWQKAVFTPAISHNHNLNVAGSIRRTHYYVSLMANQQTGLVPGTGALDIGMKINLDQVISPMVRMGIRMLVARDATDMTQSTSLLGGSSLTMSIWSVPFENMEENPYSWQNDYSDQSYAWRVIPQGYFDFNFTPWLKANITGGIDYVNKERFRWMGVQIDKGAIENGRAGQSWLQTISYDMAANLTFNKSFGNHGLQITGGGEFFGSDGVKLSNYASDFAIQTLKAQAINFASYAANPIYQTNKSMTYAVFGLARYQYKNLFDLQLGVRGDCLVNFDKSLQTYPFANAKINILQERNGYINSLALKGGWGISGKNELVPYATINDITLGDASLFIPYEEALNFTGRLASKSNQFNIGFDADFINNRIALSAQFYIGRINDRFDVYDFREAQIIETSDETGSVTSEMVPFNKIYWRRDISMNKWGIEASISALPIKTKDFTWTINANIGLDRNRINTCGIDNNSPTLGATGSQGFIGKEVSGISDLGVSAYINGLAPGVFYGYLTQGVITEDHVLLAPPFDGVRLRVGDPKYIDVNKDGSVDANDKVVIGNPNPDFIFG